MAKTCRVYPMGIDLGIKELAVVSFNNNPIVFHNINNSPCVRKLERRLKSTIETIKVRSKQNKDYRKTQDYINLQEEVFKVSTRLESIRLDYINLVTNQLVSLLPSYVVMENLDIRGMLKNKRLMKAVKEQCFGEFISQMRFKCKLMNIRFIQVPRYFPSSKTCSRCGYIKKDLRLRDRVFICPICSHTIDRDFNAATNMINYVEKHIRLTHKE